MAMKRSGSSKKGSKKTGPVKKKSSGASTRTADENSTTLPTEGDTRFVKERELPAPTTVRIVHGVVDAFTARVCVTLQKPEVAAFYGSRFRPQDIIRNAALSVESSAVAARFIHGAEVAQQIGAPALVSLMDQAALIVRDAPELIAKHPKLADGLADMLTWWATTFPGGGVKAKGDSTSTVAGGGIAAPAKVGT